MLIAISSFSGNVGKTTLAKNLFMPQLPAGARRVQVEDINTGDGKADAEITSESFRLLAHEINAAGPNDHFVIDIGSSNAKHMFQQLSEMRRVRDKIDFWVIPVVPGAKQMMDSLNVVKEFIDMGIKPEKIVVILNNVKHPKTVKTEFAEILHLTEIGVNVIDEPVLVSDVYDNLKGDDRSVFAVEAENPDFDAMQEAARAKGPEGRQELLDIADRMVVQDLSEFAAANLRRVFKKTPIAKKLSELAQA